MTKDAAYIAYDLETGGVTIKNSLLTGFFIALDKDLNEIATLDLKVKPNNNEPYIIHAQAMEVNKINLIEHDKVAKSASLSASELFNFIKYHSKDGAIKLVSIGHNVAFDMAFIYEHLINKANFNKFVSYRTLDTGAIAQYLKFIGQITDSKFGSLSSLGKMYGIEFKENEAHTCEGDTRMCVNILKAMRNAQHH